MYILKSRMLTAASKVFIEAKEILKNLTIDQQEDDWFDSVKNQKPENDVNKKIL